MYLRFPEAIVKKLTAAESTKNHEPTYTRGKSLGSLSGPNLLYLSYSI
jgi:hypothetical protein